MPYNGANDPKLPKNVKSASESKRKQWVAVWSSAYATHGDENRAFAEANSVLDAAQAKGDYIYGSDIMDRQIPQADAGYTPLGAITSGDGKGCANCRWFVSPDSCIIVRGDISPTGMSKFYSPAPALAVDNDNDAASEPDNDADDYGLVSIGSREHGIDRLAKAVVGRIKSLVSVPNMDTVPATKASNGSAKDKANANSGMTFFKDADNRLRFIATVTNNFRDREQELITEEAHREYIAWADANQKYPELWLWHAGSKSRWGKADVLDYVDGFVIASGTVDDTTEALAVAASVKADAANIAVSHGFLAAKADSQGMIHKYRMFELSPLPTWAAANEWTGFTFIDGSIQTMPFSNEKATWLKGKGATDATLKEFEASLGTIAKHLQDRGIEYKDLQGFFTATKEAGQPSNAAGVVSPSVGNPSGIHHPHTDNLVHYHYHVDGTNHEHAHTHSDGSTGHDTDQHSAMSGKSLGEHVKSVADARAMLGLKDVTNANKTKPSEYASVPDDKFLDQANWKYPVDSEHVKAAHSYFNQEGQREAGGYTPEQWASMGGKLASALGSDYEYSGGKVVSKASGSNKEIADLRADVATLTKSVADLVSAMQKPNGGTPPANGNGSATTSPPVQSDRKEGDPADVDFVKFFQDTANRLGGGYQASSASNNHISKEAAASARKEYDDKNPDGWFERDVLGSLNGIMGGLGNGAS